MEQVILNYSEAIKREGKKDNAVIIDGQRNINEIFNEVWKITAKLLEFKQLIKFTILESQINLFYQTY